MIQSVHPKLPMKSKSATLAYYVEKLQFSVFGSADFEDYLMLKKDEIEIHFFLFKDLDPSENYGQIYLRCSDIDSLYQWMLDHEVEIHPNGPLQTKPWGMKEFALLDPDNNLLTFGEMV